MKSNLEQPAPDSPVAEMPTHVILLAPFGVHVEGKVLAANDELLARLKAKGIAFRAATDAERRIGGFPD